MKPTAQEKPTVLFATPVLHHVPRSGPELRIENSIKALNKIARLYIYCRTNPRNIGGAKALEYYQGLSIKFFSKPVFFSKTTWKRQFVRIINLVSKAVTRAEVFPREVPDSNGDFHHLVKTAKAVGADLIWLGYGNISYPLLKYIKDNSNFKVVCDTDSVWSRFILRGLQYAGNDLEKRKIQMEGKEKEEEERWGTRLADMTTGVSEVDVAYYRGLAAREEQVHIFSNVIDTGSYQQEPPPPGLKNPSIYLAGTFWKGSPMEDATRWILDEIFPKVRSEIPDVHFYVVGRNSDKVLDDMSDEAVTIVGEVRSVLPYLTNVDVVTVPLRFESGTRFKILEAGACALPVVSTTLGAEGIPITHDHDIFLADDPDDFAKYIIKTIKEPEKAVRLGQNLKQLVEEKFSIDSLAYEGELILDRLLPNMRQRP